MELQESPGTTRARTGAEPPLGSEGGAREREPILRAGDRRLRPTPRFSRYSFLGGRRRAARRASERWGSFVDLYDSRLLLLIGWIALMNVLDSFFTLMHLQAGGTEVNPVADALLRSGRISFVLGKCVLISLALLVLCVHKNFRLARVGLWGASGVYTVLVLYHLSLFARH